MFVVTSIAREIIRFLRTASTVGHHRQLFKANQRLCVMSRTGHATGKQVFGSIVRMRSDHSGWVVGHPEITRSSNLNFGAVALETGFAVTTSLNEPWTWRSYRKPDIAGTTVNDSAASPILEGEQASRDRLERRSQTLNSRTSPATAQHGRTVAQARELGFPAHFVKTSREYLGGLLRKYGGSRLDCRHCAPMQPLFVPWQRATLCILKEAGKSLHSVRECPE
jgi:hypothetical protein